MIALLGNLSRDLRPGRAAAGRRGAVPRRPRAAAAARARPDRRALRGRGPRRAVRPARPARLDAPASSRARRPRRSRSRTRATAGEMSVAALGDPWRPEDVPPLPDERALGARRAARRAPTSRPRRSPRSRSAGASSSTGRASCACRRSARSSSTPTTTRRSSAHVAALKLSEEEAEVLGDPRDLPVREVLVTHGSRGVTVYAGGRETTVRGRAVADVDPTGAGDAFCAAYAAAPLVRRAPRPARRARRPRSSPRSSARGDRARLHRRRHLRGRPRDARRRPGRAVRPARRARAQPAARRRGGRRRLDGRRGRRRAARRSSSRTTPARRGASRAAASRRRARSRSPRATRTRSSTPRGTASSSRATAASSGSRSRSSCRRSSRRTRRRRLTRSSRPATQTDTRAKPARPEVGAASAPTERELAARDDHRRAADDTPSIRSAEPSTRAYSFAGRPISTPWSISISSPNAVRPWRARWTASGPAAEPVAGSSATPSAGANMRVFQPPSVRAKQLTPSVAQPRERGEVGRDRGHLGGRAELDVRVLDARCRRPRRAGRSPRPRAPRAARRRGSNGRHDGSGCVHPAEDDPRALALELDRDDAGAGLEPEHDLLQRPAEHERRRRGSGGRRTAARSRA